MSKLEPVVPTYNWLSIEPYTPNIGGLVHDLDLAAVTREDVRSELRRALAEFQVLFFRNQVLSPEQLIGVARIFGDPDKAKAFFPRHESHSLIEILETGPHAHRYGTDQWHSDITFSANPPTGTVLYAKEVPAAGGDTLWSSATRVYEALGPGLKTHLDSLEAVHSFEHSGWPRFFLAQPNGEDVYRKARGDHPPVTHPVIRTHPVTGKKVVYVNPNFTDRIKGLARQESDALLAQLFGFFVRPEFQARLRWEKNTVAVWDNRSTQHYAVADYHPQYRLMHRVTFGEDRTF